MALAYPRVGETAMLSDVGKTNATVTTTKHTTTLTIGRFDGLFGRMFDELFVGMFDGMTDGTSVQRRLQAPPG